MNFQRDKNYSVCHQSFKWFFSSNCRKSSGIHKNVFNCCVCQILNKLFIKSVPFSAKEKISRNRRRNINSKLVHSIDWYTFLAPQFIRTGNCYWTNYYRTFFSQQFCYINCVFRAVYLLNVFRLGNGFFLHFSRYCANNKWIWRRHIQINVNFSTVDWNAFCWLADKRYFDLILMLICVSFCFIPFRIDCYYESYDHQPYL